MKNKFLIVTLGDPFGVNYECMVKLLQSGAFGSPNFKAIFIGNRFHLDMQAKLLGIDLPGLDHMKFSDAIEVQNFLSEMKDTISVGPLFIDLSLPKLNEDPRSLSLQDRGQCSVLALESVPKEMNAKFAVLTCPIDKNNAHKAGFKFSGQTEFFENLWNEKGIMILAGPQLRVGLTTNHLALKDVPAVLDSNLVSAKICLMAESLKKVFDIDRPRIAVCGLNPHCSDGGLFGEEEQTMIKPAILESREKCPGASIHGPIPADTAFYRAYNGEFDGVLAQYHDQGLGPLKLVHWDSAVNVTGGLRYLRVSPDHGPAADLYGKNQASIKSFAAALELCKNWLKIS